MGYNDIYYEYTDELLDSFSNYTTAKLHPIFDPKKSKDYLNQTKVWIDAARVEHRIKDMDERYLFNVLSWLKRNQESVEFAANLPSMINDTDSYYAETVWVEESPLFKKILKQYAKVAGI